MVPAAEGPRGLPGRAGGPSPDGWAPLEEYQVHQMGILATIIQRLIATILLAVESRPNRLGPTTRRARCDLR